MESNKNLNCYNCNQLLKYKDNGLSNFCPHCGQKNRPKSLSFLEMTKDAFGAIFNLENKFYASLVALLFKPGKLTNAFINGKRVIYVKPFRLYIFSSFLNALLLALFLFTFDGYDYKILYPTEERGIHIKLKLKKDDDLVVNREKYKKSFIAHRKESIASDSKISQFFSSKQIEHLDITVADFFRNILKSISYMNFFFIPILALIFYFLYFRKSTYVDNIIHATHIFTFINFSMITLTILLFLNRFESGFYTLLSILIFSILNIWFGLYLYLSMKRFKNESHASTVVKYLAVNLIFPIIYTVGLAICLALSILIM